ncbi:Glucose/arabinose dehydrogenase, beta-propeller fold [Roseivivax lentus]|uniref:Glucose/arabinose dehydrogenase, beta-propeller fold n=1 Tax=Roseivivax lentus TaxID=633194 RepID=A0A1N7MP55_9RHOB|nr:PQQ-dependent sugar dehydrogenase [Roseivivax lentus]SIS87936.1 Glucose/arabinose dehydrogenase, beta-propeller fold [Roseivivax lentus]
MRLALTTAATLLFALPACAQDFERGARNTDFPPAFAEQFRAPLVDSGVALEVSTVADGLSRPWAVAVLPGDAGYLVTERTGTLRHIARDGTVSAPIGGVPEVLNEGQGGLLDVALAPDFAQSRRIYLSYAKPLFRGRNATAASYATLAEDFSALDDVTEFFVQEPGSYSPMHFGSRIEFDGAGHVFVTTGEHFGEGERELAQELDTTYGKTVRFTLDGAIPSDNPFAGNRGKNGEIWSRGHRNPQGALYRDGHLWTIEHGPAGGDELNRIERGKNYGWPVISYGENYNGSPVGANAAVQDGLEQPVYFWDPVIAPSGMTLYDGALFGDWQGDIFIASLNPGGIVRLSLGPNDRVTEEERLRMDLGRVRDVAVDRDGAILAVTDSDRGRLVRLTPGG